MRRQVVSNTLPPSAYVISEELRKGLGANAEVKRHDNTLVISCRSGDCAGTVRVEISGSGRTTVLSVAPVPSTASVLPVILVKVAILFGIFFSVGIIPAVLFAVLFYVGVYVWARYYHWTPLAQMICDMLRSSSGIRTDKDSAQSGG